MRGDRLRQVRLISGYSQEKLSELIGLGSRQIWRYEKGETVPDADVLADIARALNVSADYLLGLTDEPHPYIKNQAVSISIPLTNMIKAMGVEATAKFIKLLGLNIRVQYDESLDESPPLDDQSNPK